MGCRPFQKPAKRCRAYIGRRPLAAMESDGLPDGVERVEQIDEDIYRVYDTDGSVHTVRRRRPQRKGEAQLPGRG